MIDCISFVLFGSDDKYIHGCFANLHLAKILYPGWVCRVYTNIPKESGAYEVLADRPFNPPEIVHRQARANSHWRFEVALDPNVRRFIVRDCDSRLSVREYAAVVAWIQSGRQFHVMRDHPMHKAPVMGGMWGGCVNEATRKLLAAQWTPENTPDYEASKHLSDQEFLANHWWPIIKKDCLQHDSCLAKHNPGSVDFPFSLMPNERFVGEVFDELGVPKDGDWQQRVNDKPDRCRDTQHPQRKGTQ